MSYIEKFRSLLKIHNVVDSKLVRVGNKDSDGGYVLPDKLLVDVDVIYNYGVGNEITFEEDFLEQYPDKVVRSFDHTIEAYPHTDKIVDYHNEGLAPYKTDDCDSFENHVVRFNDIDKKILLKIDVEGAEYDYFNSSDFKIINNNVYGILLEVHWIDKNLEDFVQMLEKLSERFVCVSLHANNFGLIFELEGYILPSVIEVCFVKKVFYNLNLEVNSGLLSDLSIKCNKELDEFYWLLSSREDNNNYYNQYSIKLIKEYHRLHHEVHLRDTEITRLHGECANRDSEINRLNGECAVRDGEINRLHSECAVRGGEINRLNGECANRDVEINRLHGECANRDVEINRLHGECANRDVEITRSHCECAARDGEISRLHAECANQDGEIIRLHNECAVRDTEINRLYSEINLRSAEMNRLNSHISSIYTSLSWKVTKPLRAIAKFIRL